jgi:SAM-dependent MidA family methyltransferase
LTLREKIAREVRERGGIPFSRYMEMCLYDREFGYYSRDAEQFGKAGDFYTSSDVHAVFGRLMARQFDEMWRALGKPAQIEILELGPGRGLFAADVLAWSAKKFPAFFAALHYSLMEGSPALRERVKQGLVGAVDTGKSTILAAPQGGLVARALGPDVPLIFFANEFFDALPVEVVSTQGKLYISAEGDNIGESWRPSPDEERRFLDSYGVQPDRRERIEVPLLAQKYMMEGAGLVRRGFTVVIDYGYTREEQLAGRHRGTLKAFRRHSVSANPYEAPGEQDITADVNFTALAVAAEAAGVTVQPLRTQSQFLMGIGEGNQFADAFEDCRLPQERAKVALQLKHLVTPAGMGESFHVLVGSRGIAPEAAAKLSGLSFGRQGP